jgi:hypothetical protein
MPETPQGHSDPGKTFVMQSTLIKQCENEPTQRGLLAASDLHFLGKLHHAAP